MDLKKINVSKVCAVLSGGVLLVTGIQNMRYSDVRKLSDKVNGIRLEHDDFGNFHPNLNSAYSKLVYYTRDVSLDKEYFNDEIDYKVRNFIPSLSNDLVSYTFYDDYILIKLFNDDNTLYSECHYNNDGSYHIKCEKDFNANTDNYITYNFSNDGILVDSYVDDYKFEYIDGNIGDYNISKKNSFRKELYINKISRM